MAQVTVYTTEPCARCINAKALLRKRGIEFDEVNLAKDPDGRAELSRRTGMMTFPQILIGDETIGGFEDLQVAEREGRLAPALDRR
jgi:glutaredoxin 3